MFYVINNKLKVVGAITETFGEAEKTTKLLSEIWGYNYYIMNEIGITDIYSKEQIEKLPKFVD